jgi:hypothetical protein
MAYDPDNIVVKLCAEGMAKEGEGLKEEARRCFQRAWDAAGDDFEAFTAAHFLARQQPRPEERLRWNMEALGRAERITDQALESYLPSLHLNVAKCHEDLGDLVSAARHYSLAAEKSAALGVGGYSDMIRSGIAAGLRRTGSTVERHPRLKELIDRWCVRRDLRPLAFVLPAYVGDLGPEADTGKLASALHYLHATGCLDEAEQRMLEEVMATVDKRDE